MVLYSGNKDNFLPKTKPVVKATIKLIFCCFLSQICTFEDLFYKFSIDSVWRNLNRVLLCVN